MVVLIIVVLMVCRIMVGYSEGTSEHEERLKGGRQSVYKERLFGVGGFSFLLSLLVLVSSKASTTLNQLRFLFCADFLATNFEPHPDYDITLKSLILPALDPARYTGVQISQHQVIDILEFAKMYNHSVSVG